MHFKWDGNVKNQLNNTFRCAYVLAFILFTWEKRRNLNDFFSLWLYSFRHYKAFLHFSQLNGSWWHSTHQMVPGYKSRKNSNQNYYLKRFHLNDVRLDYLMVISLKWGFQDIVDHAMEYFCHEIPRNKLVDKIHTNNVWVDCEIKYRHGYQITLWILYCFSWLGN